MGDHRHRDQHYTIANRATGLVLDSGGNVGSGSPLKLWNDVDSSNLRWHILVS